MIVGRTPKAKYAPVAAQLCGSVIAAMSLGVPAGTPTGTLFRTRFPKMNLAPSSVKPSRRVKTAFAPEKSALPKPVFRTTTPKIAWSTTPVATSRQFTFLRSVESNHASPSIVAIPTKPMSR
ncbi:hypothetical protein HRbin33_01433 [bacterium HR33]|nr:hypothetical protein HRbin33_01433 [bacterium HR33]